jgi:acetylornithine/N-succinyldiaminopimelate aminotransferase
MFCYQNYGVTPDIMTLAKGLGGGVPIGAMLTTNEVATGLRPGDHGSTFGGNPLACAAGNAVMQTIEDENIIDNVRDVSDELFEKLNKLRAKYNCIRSVRGKGLLIGIEFDDTITAKGMREQLFSMGILVSAIGNSTIRLAPPLIITKSQAGQFIKALDKILKNVSGPKSVIGMLKDAFPSKKQVKESASSVGSAKIDKLDEAGLTGTKDIDILDDNDD